MPKAEKGTAKHLANAMKAKGLQRLRWYCQVCEKQCRDDNGFKCHIMSEAHLRQMLVVGENAGKHINDYSTQFKAAFVGLVSRRWGTKRVKANLVYQEYIQDKNHLHMNATKWSSLTEFCKAMGRAGIFRVDETEKGLFIAWVDNSPMTLSRQAANQLKERVDLDDEQRERNYIREQIERAQSVNEGANSNQGGMEAGPSGSSGSGSGSGEEEEDKSVKPAGPIFISFGSKKANPVEKEPESIVPNEKHESAEDLPTPDQPIVQKTEPISTAAPAPVPLKINPLKKANPLKSNALKGSASKDVKDVKSASAPTSAVEQLMMEDQERKRRREERDRYNDSKRVRAD